MREHRLLRFDTDETPFLSAQFPDSESEPTNGETLSMPSAEADARVKRIVDLTSGQSPDLLDRAIVERMAAAWPDLVAQDPELNEAQRTLIQVGIEALSHEELIRFIEFQLIEIQNLYRSIGFAYQLCVAIGRRREGTDPTEPDMFTQISENPSRVRGMFALFGASSIVRAVVLEEFIGINEEPYTPPAGFDEHEAELCGLALFGDIANEFTPERTEAAAKFLEAMRQRLHSDPSLADQLATHYEDDIRAIRREILLRRITGGIMDGLFNEKVIFAAMRIHSRHVLAARIERFRRKHGTEVALFEMGIDHREYPESNCPQPRKLRLRLRDEGQQEQLLERMRPLIRPPVRLRGGQDNVLILENADALEILATVNLASWNLSRSQREEVRGQPISDEEDQRTRQTLETHAFIVAGAIFEEEALR